MNIGHDIQMEHAFNTFLNAKSIGDHFRCFHNVTLGQKNGKTPTIGNNVVVSAESYIINESIPDNCLVFGKSPNLTIKVKTENEIKKYTKHIWGWMI